MIQYCTEVLWVTFLCTAETESSGHEEEVKAQLPGSLGNQNSEVFWDERSGCRISHLYLENWQEEKSLNGNLQGSLQKVERENPIFFG